MDNIGEDRILDRLDRLVELLESIAEKLDTPVYHLTIGPSLPASMPESPFTPDEVYKHFYGTPGHPKDSGNR